MAVNLGDLEQIGLPLILPSSGLHLKDAAREVRASHKESKVPAGNTPETMKMLMIHGFVQNSAIFHSRTSNLRSKALKAAGSKKLDFVFADSSLKVHPSLASSDVDVDGRAWFNPQEAIDGDTSVRPVLSKDYRGWQEPLEELRSQAQTEGPVSGILAFSQGGVPAALLMSELREQIRFGIFVSCFAPMDVEVRKLLSAAEQEPIDVPTLHVVGLADPLVTEERSRDLAALFKNPSFAKHDGGHIMIPKELFGTVKEFLAKVV
eukprot:TRINITY_DN98736_c0_g1_i1.p1 TRINITY_DN98736_c0_g1~~TRINITY_DN98736_c0_g1_i1.p1  ORF type:complete len:263 (-),score=57.50 TRINITY_DN98736_c0_g1_i1:57-845(-)